MNHATAKLIPEEIPVSAPPVCPFCRTRPAANREHDCPADDMVRCRCCPVCRTANCYRRARGEGVSP